MRPVLKLLPYLLMFVVALALRLYGIETQSLWADEGGTIAVATRSLPQITHDTLQDVHPPLYFWLLHGWIQPTGTSVLAVRGFSALCGALAAALTALLARRWFGNTAAVIAGLTAACSPFAIHYSQETRMYALALLLGVLLWLALSAWRAQPHWRHLALYGVAALALLYTHYFAVTIVAASCLAGLLPLEPDQRGEDFVRARPSHSPFQRDAQRVYLRQTISWLAAHALVGALYLPLVWASRPRLSGWTAAKEPTGPLFIVQDLLRIYSIGPSTPAEWSPWLFGFLVLFGAGVMFGNRLHSNEWRYSILWLVLPVGLMVLLSLNQPYYKPRFLLPALPAFHLLLGAGAALIVTQAKRLSRVSWSGKPVIAVIALFVILAARQPLANEWFDPAYWRDDYRGIAQSIAASAGPNDALILNGQSQIETLDFYLKNSQARYLLPRFRPLEPAATIHELETIAGQHQRVYTIFYVLEEADPAGVMPNWLAEHAFRAGSRWYGDAELAIYEFGDLTGSLRTQQEHFGPQLQLIRSAADTTGGPGDAIRVQLEWQTNTPAEHPLNIFVHLLNGSGQIIAQYDGPLTAQPSTTWMSGETHTGRVAVLVPPGTPPGNYQLLIGVFDPVEGARLPRAGGGDSLILETVEVGEN